jgi:hypothetical protein
LLFLVIPGCRPLPPPVDGGFITYRGKMVYWEPKDFPLYVAVDDNMTPEQIDAALSAAYIWNDNLGVEAFKPVVHAFSEPLPRNYGFVLVSVKDLDNTSLGSLNGMHQGHYHPRSVHRAYSEVWYDEDLKPDVLELVMVHELGHALCLDHDNDLRSVMHPHVVSMKSPIFIMPDDLYYIRHMINAGNWVHSKDLVYTDLL